jgi:hypothetical protein
MEAIEFKTKIKDGAIQIPEKYRQKTGNTVKVIIISDQVSKRFDIIDELLANPIDMKAKDFLPFSRDEIYETF